MSTCEVGGSQGRYIHGMLANFWFLLYSLTALTKQKFERKRGSAQNSNSQIAQYSY